MVEGTGGEGKGWEAEEGGKGWEANAVEAADEALPVAERRPSENAKRLFRRIGGQRPIGASGDAACDSGDAVCDSGDAVCDSGDAVCDSGDAVCDSGDAVCDSGDAVCDSGDAVCDSGEDGERDFRGDRKQWR